MGLLLFSREADELTIRNTGWMVVYALGGTLPPFQNDLADGFARFEHGVSALQVGGVDGAVIFFMVERITPASTRSATSLSRSCWAIISGVAKMARVNMYSQ